MAAGIYLHLFVGQGKLKVLEEKKEKGLWTHHSVSNRVTVGPQLRVDVGEEPTERPAAEPRSKGFSLRNISNVYSRGLHKDIDNNGKKYINISQSLTYLKKQVANKKCQTATNIIYG